MTLDRQEGENAVAGTGDTDSVSQASALLFHPKFSPPVTAARCSERPAGAAVTLSPTRSSTAVAISRLNLRVNKEINNRINTL